MYMSIEQKQGYLLIDHPRDKYDDSTRWEEREETGIQNEIHLRRELSKLRHTRARGVHFVAPNGDSLFIGIKRDMACIEFIQASGEPPYLWALGNLEGVHHNMTISVGNTPTPILSYLFLPFADVLRIVTFFFRTGELLWDFDWMQD